MVKTVMVSLCCISCSLLTAEITAAEAQPEIEFLEYLAGMESDRGEWLDVIQVDELAKNDQIDETIDEHKAEQGND